MIFEFFIGGFFENNRKVTYDNNRLLCYFGRYGLLSTEPTHIIPIDDTNANWIKLLSFLESIKWESTYDTLICDGTQWTLDAEFKGVNIHCYGSNAYPPDFKVFLKRLNKVIEHEEYDFELTISQVPKCFKGRRHPVMHFYAGFQHAFYHFQSIARLPKL
ncbi:MAG: hypothetical protein IPL22_07580 [Bacteroidetes bacterium]|nr:hypothetical protein [Bacteroidota bacterium]